MQPIGMLAPFAAAAAAAAFAFSPSNFAYAATAPDPTGACTGFTKTSVVDPYPALIERLSNCLSGNLLFAALSNDPTATFNGYRTKLTVNGTIQETPYATYISAFPACFPVTSTSNTSEVIAATLTPGKSSLAVVDTLLYSGAPNLNMAYKLYNGGGAIANASLSPGAGNTFSAIETVLITNFTYGANQTGYKFQVSTLVSYDSPLFGLMISGYGVGDNSALISFYDDHHVAFVAPTDPRIRNTNNVFNASNPAFRDQLIALPPINLVNYPDLPSYTPASAAGMSTYIEAIESIDGGTDLVVAATIYPQIASAGSNIAKFYYTDPNSNATVFNTSYQSVTNVQIGINRCYPYLLFFRNSAVNMNDPPNWQFVESQRLTPNRTQTGAVDYLPCDFVRGRVKLAMDLMGEFVTYSVPSWSTVGLVDLTDPLLTNYRIRNDEVVASGSALDNFGKSIAVSAPTSDFPAYIAFASNLFVFFFDAQTFMAGSDKYVSSFTGENTPLLLSAWNIPNPRQPLPANQVIEDIAFSSNFFAFYVIDSQGTGTFITFPRLSGGYEFSLSQEQVAVCPPGTASSSNNPAFFPCLYNDAGTFTNASGQNFTYNCGNGYYCPESAVIPYPNDRVFLTGTEADLVNYQCETGPEFEESFFIESFEEFLVNRIFGITYISLQVALAFFGFGVLLAMIRYSHLLFIDCRHSTAFDFFVILHLLSLNIIRLFGFFTVKPGEGEEGEHGESEHEHEHEASYTAYRPNEATLSKRIIHNLNVSQLFMKKHKKTSYIGGFIFIITAVLLISALALGIVFFLSYPNAYAPIIDKNKVTNRFTTTVQRSVSIAPDDELVDGFLAAEHAPFNVSIDLIGFGGSCDATLLKSVSVSGCNLVEGSGACGSTDNIFFTFYETEQPSTCVVDDEVGYYNLANTCSVTLALPGDVLIDQIFNFQISIDVGITFAALRFTIANSLVSGSNFDVPAYTFSEIVTYRLNQAQASNVTDPAYLPNSINRNWVRTRTAYSYQTGIKDSEHLYFFSDIYNLITSFEARFFENVDGLTFWTNQAQTRTISLTLNADTQFVWNYAAKLVQDSNGFFTLLLGMIGILHLSDLLEVLLEIVHYFVLEPIQKRLKTYEETLFHHEKEMEIALGIESGGNNHGHNTHDVKQNHHIAHNGATSVPPTIHHSENHGGAVHHAHAEGNHDVEMNHLSKREKSAEELNSTQNLMGHH